MKIKIALLFAFFFLFESYAQEIIKKSVFLMGSDFEITVVAESIVQGEKAIHLAINEIIRIENLISSWKETSETSSINKAAGIEPVKVSKELFDLIDRSLKISKLTDGAFDISYASMDRIWKFDGSMTAFPSEEHIKNSISKVGFENILLDAKNQTVFLKLKGMKIGFGAIGKGYAADKAKSLLKNMGIDSGIINASGDINSWGNKPDGTFWQVAITNPLNKNNSFGTFPISNQSVVTSGNYEKFVNFNGKRYSHIIDPRTGYPSTGILSVTIFAPKAELADALATAVFVMGTEIGIDRINQLKQIECILVKEDGSIELSNNIKLNN